MAEKGAGEREEAATPKKLKEAKGKGQVARSKELTTSMLLMAAAAALYSYAATFASAIGSVAQKAFTPDRKYLFSEKHMLSALGDLFTEVGVAFLPFFLVLFIIGLFSSILLGGLTFSFKTIAPKANRMSIGKGFKRMLGLHALIELIKALAKISVVFVVGYFVMKSAFPSLIELSLGEVRSSILSAMQIVAFSFFLLSMSLLVIALIDVPYQIWNHAKELKMSKQEVKDEFKETEGKPEVKGKIRQKQREISQQRMMESVPQADVVVTNPEHYSVALKYDVMKSGAPIVVAKGVDIIAVQIKKVALANDVQILRLPPLARAIYHTTEINHEVPQGLYLSVAQVLAFVFQLRSFNQGKGDRPDKLGEIEIPEDFKYS